MAEWTTKPIDAPAGDMLTAGEVAKLFRVSEDTIKRLVAEGEFPRPLRVGKQTLLWDWKAVVYYRLRQEMMPRMTPEPAATGGQLAATRG